MIKSVALYAAYEIIIEFDGSKIIEGFSMDNLGGSSANCGDYQLIFRGIFDNNSLNCIQPVLDKYSLKMTMQSDSVLISSE